MKRCGRAGGLSDGCSFFDVIAADDSDNVKRVDYPDKGACYAPLQNFQTDIVALEAEIGQLVYALYGLADDEIALVEEKK